MSRYAFFRQTGWMLGAAVLGGVFTFLVTPILTKDLWSVLRRPLTGEEYGLFGALLGLVSLLSTPSTGLQSTVAHQTASAVSPEQEQKLRGTLRRILQLLFGVWLLAIATVFILQTKLMADFKIYHPASLWVTMLIGLPVLWQPVLSGILQGKQNFLWLGWQSILNGFVRCIAVFVFVRLMGVYVTGVMAAVFLGSCTSLAISFWQTWPVLRGPPGPVDWMGLRRVIPLSLGLGAAAFLLVADTIFVRRSFPEDQTGLYSGVATIGRALMYLIIPMTQVMFPKVVQAAARSETTDAMTHALAATGLIGVTAALGCTLLPEIPLKLLLGPEYLQAKGLVQVYAWCVIPLTLATVLINNLMAREHYRSVPWLVGVAALYWVALSLVASRVQASPPLEALRAIALTFGTFGLLLLALTVWFTIKKR